MIPYLVNISVMLLGNNESLVVIFSNSKGKRRGRKYKVLSLLKVAGNSYPVLEDLLHSLDFLKKRRITVNYLSFNEKRSEIVFLLFARKEKYPFQVKKLMISLCALELTVNKILGLQPLS